MTFLFSDYDNSNYMEINEVSLTSVHYDKRRGGVLAAQIIWIDLEDKKWTPTLLQPRLVIREFCKGL